MTQPDLKQLLSSMTTQEKALQLCQIDISVFLSDAAAETGPMAACNLPPEKLMEVGSILCGGNVNAAEVAKLQEQIIERSPHHIPLVIMSDVIHGMRTIFPIPLALACTFDPDVTETMAQVSAAEAAASGIHATFAPMADVARDPRWGRCMESAGEAPLLNADMAAAAVRGFRGKSIAARDTLASCVKHFAAYGLVEAGREYAPVDVSHTELFNTYFPPFRAALNAGCDLLMPAFTPVDREPAVMNRWLMHTVLREEWGFDGVVISDWAAPAEMIAHGVAKDKRQAAALCMDAALDMDMMGMVYMGALTSLVDDGAVSMDALDRAVMRVLQLKNKLGLFETPCKNTSAKRQEATCTDPEHRQAALDAAVKSCVLLQNDGVLPLTHGHKIALAGDMADTSALIGGWAAGGRADETPSLRDAFPEACAPEDADIILFAAGEPQDETGEAASKVSPSLTGEQMAELKRLHALGKPIVLLLFCGRPFILTDALPFCSAALVCWFPGSEGAQAIRILLMGDRNPSGHLSMSFPRSVGQIPIHHDSLTTARPKLPESDARYVSWYTDSPNTPLFPFGFGLSYTSFSISNPVLSAPEWKPGDTLEIACDVQNTGDRYGETVVQLYLTCEYSPRMHPLRTLAGYRRVGLSPGETRQVALPVTDEALRTFDSQGHAEIPKSRWLVALGEDSTAPVCAAFHSV